MRGELILVVGPSGVGKDTLLDGARARLAGDPRFHFARRAVTRPREAGGEDHEPITEAEFERRVAEGAFFAHWRANGLGYGAPTEIEALIAQGLTVVLNGSRSSVDSLAEAGLPLAVIHVDAAPETIAARLQARGRESAAEIAARRSRAPFAPRSDLRVAYVANDGTIEQGVERFLDALLGFSGLRQRLKRAPLSLWREPLCVIHRDSLLVSSAALGEAAMVEIEAGGRSARARLALASDTSLVALGEAALSDDAFDRLGAPEGAWALIRRTPSPKSRAALRKKVGGAALGPGELETVVRDLIEGRYSPAETAGFLVAASRNLDLDELAALTRLRAELMTPLRWDAPRIVDKHSIGGAPGGRVTLILAPIVAAHGLLIPKTSSRAITSAAGTADVMEAAARVDLDRSEMVAAVAAAGGCVLWNGRINHSPLDDVMNAINRPLGVSSRLLDVSSILSKKLVAGATHALVDIPVGRGAKIADEADGRALAALFETVGRRVGLVVEARVSAGGAPVGRGIGPALELRDVLSVLAGATDAPADLREKALRYAGRLLDWDPDLPEGRGRARAEALLASGAALEAFERMVAAQGPAERRAEPGLFTREIRAPRSGRIARYDGFALAGLARAAGAPADKAAGIDLLVLPGETAQSGQPLLRLHASREDALLRALEEEAPDKVFEIA